MKTKYLTEPEATKLEVEFLRNKCFEMDRKLSIIEPVLQNLIKYVERQSGSKNIEGTEFFERFLARGMFAINPSGTISNICLNDEFRNHGGV